MVVFKADAKNNGYNTIDFSDNGKHIMFSMGLLHNLILCLYYESEKPFSIRESFQIDKSNKQLYDIIDGIFFSYGGRVFFDTEGAKVTLTEDENGYKFIFDRTFDEKNGIIESKFVNNTEENNSMNNLFMKLQTYDFTKDQEPKEHLNSNAKKLKKCKKKIES